MSTVMPDFSFKHVDQVDEPTFSASDLKDHLDVQAREIRNWFNATHIGTDKIHIGDNPSARVYHSVSQSIANSSYVALAFNSETFDTDTIHDTVTNNSRLTAKTPGKYFICGNIRFAGNSVGFRGVTIKLNGVDIIADIESPNNGVDFLSLIISSVYNLSVNDYVELLAYQNSGGALNVEAFGKYSPHFMMVRVG